MENNNLPIELEGLKLDADNKEFMKSLDYALRTDKTIYLTGKAGTGKTTFLKYLKKITHKKMIVLAPTGVAAINASGETIHSFFHLQPSVYLPEDSRLKTDKELDNPNKKSIFKYLRFRKSKVELIRNLETIVIDEVSMVRCDIMDAIDKILRAYRDSTLPFGGVQMILIGDVYQLPPIVKKDEQEILGGNYDGLFFFHSKVMERVINENQLVYIELQKIYRQKDKDFIELLNRVRVNDMQERDFALFDSKVSSEKQLVDKTNHIILTTTNVKVKYINEKRLSALRTRSRVYEAVVTGAFAEKERPTDTMLELKVGAQIIFIRNDKEKRYHNGKLGVIKYMNDEYLLIETETNNGDKYDVTVYPETWKSVSYNWNQTTNVIEEKILGTFEQFPVKLAWAITVHKSQGMTFDRVVADIGNSFEIGQVYVALSRCTSLEGLVLSSKIKPKSIITDSKVMEFSNKMSESCVMDDIAVMDKTEQIDEKARLYSELRELREYVRELEKYKSQQVELYGSDTVSSLRKKLTYKENEYQEEIARLNVKNRELKETIKKLEGRGLSENNESKTEKKPVVVSNEELHSENIKMKLEIKDMKQKYKRRLNQIEMLKRLTDRQNKQIQRNSDYKKTNQGALSRQYKYIKALEDFVVKKYGKLPELKVEKIVVDENEIDVNILIEEVDNLLLEVFTLQEQVYNANEIIYIIKNKYNISDDFLIPLDGKDEVLEFIALYEITKKPSIVDNDDFVEKFRLNKAINTLTQQLRDRNKELDEQKQTQMQLQSVLRDQLDESRKIIDLFKAIHKVNYMNDSDLLNELDNIRSQMRGVSVGMLTKNLKESRKKIKEKEEEVKALKQKIEELVKNNNVDVKPEPDDEAEKIAERNYKSILSIQEYELDRLKKKVKYLQKKDEDKTEEITALRKENEEIVKNSVEKEASDKQKIIDLNAELEQNKQQLENYYNSILELRDSEILRLKREIDSLVINNEQLSADTDVNDAAKSHDVDLNAELEKCRKQLEIYYMSILDLRDSEILKLKKEVNSLVIRNEKLTNDSEMGKNTLADLNAELERCRQEIKSYTLTLSMKESELKRLNKKLESLKKKNDEAVAVEAGKEIVKETKDTNEEKVSFFRRIFGRNRS